MAREKPKVTLTHPKNNDSFPLGTSFMIELEIKVKPGVSDPAVGLLFLDLVKSAQPPVFNLNFKHTCDTNVLKVSFSHLPADRGDHVLSCLGWFRGAANQNSPHHNDKNVDHDKVKYTVT